MEALNFEFEAKNKVRDKCLIWQSQKIYKDPLKELKMKSFRINVTTSAQLSIPRPHPWGEAPLVLYKKICPCAHKQKRRHFHAKTTSAKLYIYVGVGSVHWRSTHGAGHIPLCGIFFPVFLFFCFSFFHSVSNFYLWCFKSDFDAVKGKFGLLIE